MQGTKKFKDEPGMKPKDMKKRVVKAEEEVYDDEFVAGTFQPLASFARKRNLGHMQFHPLIDYIQTELKLRVCQNKRDEWGVEIMDQDDDGSYRFKRGAREGAKKSKEEIHDSKMKDHISNFQILWIQCECHMNGNWVPMSTRCPPFLQLFHVEF